MILCVGDGHIHDDCRLNEWRRLTKYISEEMPSELIFSELRDPWASSSEKVTRTATYQLVRALCAERYRRGLITRIVLGNHDWKEKKIYVATLPGVQVLHRHENREFVFEHGWQKDWTWNAISPVAFWIADKWPSLGLTLYNLITRRTPGQGKDEVYDACDPPGGHIELTDVLMYEALAEDWNWHVELIHDRYRAKAQKTKSHIIWHTHCPWRFDGLIANCGDFIDSYTWLEIRGKGVKLCALEDLQ